jgi:hypothetical protein
VTERAFGMQRNFYNNPPHVGLSMVMPIFACPADAQALDTRQLTKKVRLLLSYTYFDYSDETSGGHNNYQAHSIFSSLQFRF